MQNGMAEEAIARPGQLRRHIGGDLGVFCEPACDAAGEREAVLPQLDVQVLVPVVGEDVQGRVPPEVRRRHIDVDPVTLLVGGGVDETGERAVSRSDVHFRQ